MESQVWGPTVWGLKDLVFASASLSFPSIPGFQHLPKCVSGGKLLAYLEKTSSKVDYSGGTPIGTRVQAEGRH